MPIRNPRNLNAPMTVAWENEFDMIYPNGNMDGGSYYTPCAEGWSYQTDGTTGTEHRSPVWTSILQAANSIQRQYARWSPANDNGYPLCQNGHGLHSSGHHVHFGKGVGTHLESHEISAIGKHFRLILPLIQAISASPLPSQRGLRSTYCNPILNYGDNFTNDHYNELSWNTGVGTAECRIPDPNVPPVVLTNLYILGHVSEHARELCHCSSEELRFDRTEYSRLRTQALTHGVTGIPVAQLLTRVKNWLGVEADSFPVNSVRDVLFLAAKYYSSPHQIFSMMRPNLYQYMKVMFEEPHEYLANLAEITTGENRIRVQSWINEVQSITNIQQLIDIASTGMTRLQAQMGVTPTRPVVVVATATFTLNRSEVVRAVENRSFNIVRITDVPNMTVEQVREKIAFLLSRCGDGFTNPVSVEQVSSLPTRFYVMMVPRGTGSAVDIVGCIGVNVGERARRARDSEIGHLVVHRMYRRLGISKTLLNHAKAIALENNQQSLHAHIKIGNRASEALFQSAGFTPTTTTNDDNGNPVSRKWVLSLQVQRTETPPGPAARPVAPATQGAFSTPNTDPNQSRLTQQSTLADLVRQMEEEERRGR